MVERARAGSNSQFVDLGWFILPLFFHSDNFQWIWLEWNRTGGTWRYLSFLRACRFSLFFRFSTLLELYAKQATLVPFFCAFSSWCHVRMDESSMEHVLLLHFLSNALNFRSVPPCSWWFPACSWKMPSPPVLRGWIPFPMCSFSLIR